MDDFHVTIRAKNYKCFLLVHYSKANGRFRTVGGRPTCSFLIVCTWFDNNKVPLPTDVLNLGPKHWLWLYEYCSVNLSAGLRCKDTVADYVDESACQIMVKVCTTHRGIRSLRRLKVRHSAPLGTDQC